jgi:hypothetical protein
MRPPPLIPPWREVLRSMLGVLPAVLGGAALLLGLVVLLGESAAGASLLGAVLALPLAALLAQMLREAWMTGVLPGRYRHTRREEQPVLYLAGMAFYAACTLALLALGAWCLWRVVVR